MHLRRAAVGSVVTVVVALGLSGCAQDAPDSEPDTPAPSTTSQRAAAPQPAGLPAPETLTDVLYRIADPELPGTEKLQLIEGATAADAATLDKFTNALRDNGYTPPSLAVDDIGWSDSDPADVEATVTVHKPDSDVGFSIPMEFKPDQDGWQLSADTFDMLLNYGKPSAPPR
jgi:hypothetical protein